MTEPQDIIDEETTCVIDDALNAITLVQQLPSDSLAAKEPQAAVTLARAARSRLARLVAEARDQQTSWSEIGRILGTGRFFAACR